MIGRIDPEGVEARVLHDLVDFTGKDVLEIGCGDGRVIWRFADAAASVLAFDPDEAAIAAARSNTSDDLKGRVSFRVAGVMDVRLTEGAYDVAIFSHSI